MARKGKDQEEKVKFWNEYWPELQKATGDSEEHLDKKIFGVSSAAIALELTIIQFIDKPHCLILAKLAAIFSIAALTLNIAVQLLGQTFQHKQEDMIESFLYAPSDNDAHIHKRIKKHNGWLLAINIISLLFLVSGIILLTVFTLHNI